MVCLSVPSVTCLTSLIIHVPFQMYNCTVAWPHNLMVHGLQFHYIVMYNVHIESCYTDCSFLQVSCLAFSCCFLFMLVSFAHLNKMTLCSTRLASSQVFLWIFSWCSCAGTNYHLARDILSWNHNQSENNWSSDWFHPHNTNSIKLEGNKYFH